MATYQEFRQKTRRRALQRRLRRLRVLLIGAVTLIQFIGQKKWVNYEV